MIHTALSVSKIIEDSVGGILDLYTESTKERT